MDDHGCPRVLAKLCCQLSVSQISCAPLAWAKMCPSISLGTSAVPKCAPKGDLGDYSQSIPYIRQKVDVEAAKRAAEGLVPMYSFGDEMYKWARAEGWLRVENRKS